jgi:hypothetical protein
VYSSPTDEEGSGSPWENGSIESYIGKLRDELLNGEILDTLMEAKVLVQGWRREYNWFRPHSSLGNKPPAPEAYEVEKFTLGLVPLIGDRSAVQVCKRRR